MVRAEFCVPVLHIPRWKQKELGAGAMLDLGIYCLQFICMVFNGEKPECVQAMGVCLETGNTKTDHEGLTDMISEALTLFLKKLVFFHLYFLLVRCNL